VHGDACVGDEDDNDLLVYSNADHCIVRTLYTTAYHCAVAFQRARQFSLMFM